MALSVTKVLRYVNKWKQTVLCRRYLCGVTMQCENQQIRKRSIEAARGALAQGATRFTDADMLVWLKEIWKELPIEIVKNSCTGSESYRDEGIDYGADSASESKTGM